MPLDRSTVERTAAEHIRRLQQADRLSDDRKREIRRMHERIARKVDAKHNR